MTDELPRHLDRETMEQLARECDTMYEFTQQARIGRNDARHYLHHLGIDAEFDRPAYELVHQNL